MKPDRASGTGNDVAGFLHPVLVEDFERMAATLEADELARSRWLITGATGFVPAYLVRFLAWLNARDSLGMEIHLWVRSREKAGRLFPWTGKEDPSWRVTAPDWERPADWTVPPCEYLVHAASPATPRACQADPHGVLTCNVTATHALLRKAEARSLKGFLFFSSSEVYGDTGRNAYPSESEPGLLDPASPRVLYPLAKRLGEAVCHEAWHAQSLPVRIARIFHTYGPGMDLANDGRVFADFLHNIVKAEDIVLRSDGSGRRAFAYLSDTVSGLLAILLRGEKDGCYNVGNREAVLSVSELADLLVDLAPAGNPKKVVMDEKHPQSASRSVYPDTHRLESLGWRPGVDPREGFARTLRSYTT